MANSPFPTSIRSASAGSALATNKLIRNTYTLLSITLLFSALMAGVSVMLQLPFMANLLCIGGALVLLWFVLPRTANSTAGIGVVFGITGLMGLALGPIIGHYLNLPNGAQTVGTAFGGTAAIFLGLSGYALVSRRDFSFMGGFLFTGMIVVLLAAIGNMFFAIPALSLAISAAVIFIMSGFILYDTSRMVNGGETNYLHATVGLYLSIFNIFVHLLQLLGIMGGDD
ncbi:MAG: modulator of FtsH protease [Gammaproteobacteria bacterium]|jgi:modulator of FtsH protease